MVDLYGNPFYLSESQAKWVTDTVNSMTEDELIGQVFALICRDCSPEGLSSFIGKYSPGGIFMIGKTDDPVDAINMAQSVSRIPLIVSCDAETGGNYMLPGSTNVATAIEVAAAGDPKYAGWIGEVSAKEMKANGENCSFAPVIDIMNNFRNPILTVRTFGKDPEFIRDCGIEYVKNCQGNGVPACLKHFPGDGMDERDQHLVASVNSCSTEEWDKTYGMIYKSCIDAGVKMVMAGHIHLPSYVKKFNPSIKDEDIMPATLSPELINGLLREQLGFNGMVITDASSMIGYYSMDRRKAIPVSLAAGCDMILFQRDLEEDFRAVRDGIKEGILTWDRLREAVTRILALKASADLNLKKADGSIAVTKEQRAAVMGTGMFRHYDEEIADKAITLVKDTRNILPLDPKKHRRVLLYPYIREISYMTNDTGVLDIMVEELEKEGFEVTVFKTPEDLSKTTAISSSYKYGFLPEHFDLILYMADMLTDTYSNDTHLHYMTNMGTMDAPTYYHTIPTVFISFANPYHLLDFPRVPVYINAYKAKRSTIHAVVQKMLGKSEFKGVSPVDPFLGMWDTRL